MSFQNLPTSLWSLRLDVVEGQKESWGGMTFGAKRSSRRSSIPRDQRISEKKRASLFNTAHILVLQSGPQRFSRRDYYQDPSCSKGNALAMASQAVSVVCVGMAGKAMKAQDRRCNSRTVLTKLCYRLWKDDIHAKNQFSSSFQKNRPLCHEPRPRRALSAIRQQHRHSRLNQLQGSYATIQLRA